MKGFEKGILSFFKLEPEKTPKIIDRLTIINNVITRDGKVDRTKASTLKQGDPATFYVSHFSKKKVQYTKAHDDLDYLSNGLTRDNWNFWIIE